MLKSETRKYAINKSRWKMLKGEGYHQNIRGMLASKSLGSSLLWRPFSFSCSFSYPSSKYHHVLGPKCCPGSTFRYEHAFQSQPYTENRALACCKID